MNNNVLKLRKGNKEQNMLIPRQQNLWTITTRKKARFCVSFFVLVRFCSAKPVACGRVTERARETRLRFPLHTFPSLRYAGVRTTKVVGNHNKKKTRGSVSFQLVKKVPCGTFLTALSAEHFERVQNAISKSLAIARLLAAVYLI